MGVKLLEHVLNALPYKVIVVRQRAHFFCEKKCAEAAVTCRHWQGDEVRGKQSLRGSGYAKINF
jgi:hypothetical protein